MVLQKIVNRKVSRIYLALCSVITDVSRNGNCHMGLFLQCVLVDALGYSLDLLRKFVGIPKLLSPLMTTIHFSNKNGNHKDEHRRKEKLLIWCTFKNLT